VVDVDPGAVVVLDAVLGVVIVDVVPVVLEVVVGELVLGAVPVVVVFFSQPAPKANTRAVTAIIVRRWLCGAVILILLLINAPKVDGLQKTASQPNKRVISMPQTTPIYRRKLTQNIAIALAYFVELLTL